ncbi:MAG: ABC transporter permease [Spirochaetia bacterium]|nr:ABC transporter permease [Spirochaetota bacterium]MCX8097132.1 ABC transporter permease [Spirochaetota bacterium]MDW8112099.1 ABC transporter permease [Spirochaetia bacterium]
MKKIWYVFKKELTVYFTTPVAYISMLGFLAISGYLFHFYISYTRISDMSRVLSNMIIAGMLISPLLTMRLLSEEKKVGTYELLRTSPLKTYQIVIGKYLASLVIFLSGLLLTLMYVVIMLVYGKPDIGTIVSGYIGFTLTMSAFLSIGLLASSMSQNQMVSGIIGFALLFLLWFIDVLSGIVADDTISSILTEISFLNHYTNFLTGVIDIKDIAFFVFWIILSLTLTTKIVDLRAWRN